MICLLSQVDLNHQPFTLPITMFGAGGASVLTHCATELVPYCRSSYFLYVLKYKCNAPVHKCVNN